MIILMLFSYLYFCLIIAYKMKTDLKIKSNLGEKVYLIIYFHLTLLREAGVQREDGRKELKHRPGRNVVYWLALFLLLSLLSPTSRRVACSYELIPHQSLVKKIPTIDLHIGNLMKTILGLLLMW